MYKWMLFGFFMMLSISAGAESVDPTKPVSYNSDLTSGSGEGDDVSISETAQIKLTSILFSEDRKIAVINGEFKKEGDMVGGYQVVQIFPYKVSLKKDNETKVVALSDPILKSVEKEEIK